MVRELRKRTSRPNYTLIADFEDEQEAGPSKAAHVSNEDADVSGSDFAPDQDENAPVDEEDDGLGEGDGDISAITPSDDEAAPPSEASRPSGGKKATKKGKQKESGGGGRGQTSQLPSVHHRHRAMPIFRRDGKVERLKEPPELFKAPVIVPTNSWSFNGSSNERIGRAHGFNVGPGPLWELMEDRGWYKECFEQDDQEDEASRRPRVHQNMRVPNDWEILGREEAALYIPTNSETDRSSSSISCSFGLFKQQTRVVMNTFDSVNVSSYLPESNSHVFNAGAGVWGLDWCPIHPDDRAARSHKQYLAVSPLSSKAHEPLVGKKLTRPAPACIQIWVLSPPQPEDTDRSGYMRCEMVLCVESGSAHELKWCPLASHDPIKENGGDMGPRKLGIIAGTFEDGSVSFYVVPDPADMKSRTTGSVNADPVFVKMSQPILRLELEDAVCWCLDWANSEIIAVGCTNGCVAVYDIAMALRKGQTGLDERILPTHYFSVHQSAIRAITWIRVPTVSATGKRTADNPTVLATGGYDGVESFSDIRERTGIVMSRTRDVVNTMNYSAFYGGPITVDQENTVKAYSLSPSMLGRGHKLLEPNGPIWNINSSDYHPQIAVGASDGCCLTTNILRSTRRGGSVPFFEHKIYQLDYSRKSKEYRMLENFLPQETQDRPTATKAKKILPIGTGAWSPEVGVQRVVWNAGNGLGGAPLLASATGSGLCRVDWLLGRWHRDRVAYMSVETIRQEVDGEEGMDEDSE